MLYFLDNQGGHDIAVPVIFLGIMGAKAIYYGYHIALISMLGKFDNVG